MGMRSPFMRSIGGTPTARCTSEQPCCIPSFKNASMRAKESNPRVFSLTEACDGETGVKCDAVRDSPRAKRCIAILKANTEVYSSANCSSTEFFEGVAQQRHGLVALVLVDGHRLHDDFRQTRRQPGIDLTRRASLAL